jgi:hypothetical protein
MAYVNGSARPMGAYFSQQGSPIYSGAGAYFSQQGSPIYSGAGAYFSQQGSPIYAGAGQTEGGGGSNPLVVLVALGAIGFLAWKLFGEEMWEEQNSRASVRARSASKPELLRDVRDTQKAALEGGSWQDNKDAVRAAEAAGISDDEISEWAMKAY